MNFKSFCSLISKNSGIKFTISSSKEMSQKENDTKKYECSGFYHEDEIWINTEVKLSSVRWSVLFHEIGHATGEPYRLNRIDFSNDCETSPMYHIEEIIAERIAIHFMKQFGLENVVTIDLSNEYLTAHWKRLNFSDRKQQIRFMKYTRDEAKKAIEYINQNWIKGSL